MHRPTHFGRFRIQKLFTLALCALAIGHPAVGIDARANEPAPRQRYRVIFNCDGHAVAKDANGDLDQWIANLFGPLENSHVDALFWCDGAGGNTANYDSKVLERTGARSGKPQTYIDKWIADGNDPPSVVVREARKRNMDVFYSFRINDIHDSFIPDEMPTFKIENPHWMLGEQRYGDVTSFKTALNFAVPEVRELKFRVVEELFQNYEFDGLEIDFLRSSPYFLPGTEAKNAHLLTSLLKRIRNHLNEVGNARKRPIRLAVRVNESLRSSALDGYDVAAWIENELVDIVTLGSGVMDIELAEFKDLAKDKGVHVYPCLYGWPSRYNPIPAELATGLALNYHAQDADGIYLFNWFPHTANNSESTGTYMAGLLKQIGDPAILGKSQKKVMFAVDRGRPQRAYQYNWLHCILPEALSIDQPLEVSLRVYQELSKDANLTMRLLVDELEADDAVAVTLNKSPILNWKKVAPNRLESNIRTSQLRIGKNSIQLQLTSRSDKSTKPRTVTAVELHVIQP